MPITVRSVEALSCPQNKSQTFLWDDQLKGFGVRCTPTQKKSWIVQARVKRKERRVTIGAYPSMKPAAARQLAMQALVKASAGSDIRKNKDAPETVSDLFDHFVETHLPSKSAGYAATCRANFERYVRPAIGEMAIKNVTSKDIRQLKTRIGRQVTANRILAMMSKMMNMALTDGNIDRNPVKGIERYREKPRRKYLNDRETARLWRACSDSSAGDVVKLLLLTGARVGELLSAEWSHIDLDTGIWTKPTTKTGDLHTVTLSNEAVAVLINKAKETTTRWVFPNPDETGPQKSIKTAWKTLTRSADIEGVNVHDLRHSHASFLVNAGFTLSDVAAALGHKSTRTSERYAHLSLDRQRKASDLIGEMMVVKSDVEI